MMNNGPAATQQHSDLLGGSKHQQSSQQEHKFFPRCINIVSSQAAYQTARLIGSFWTLAWTERIIDDSPPLQSYRNRCMELLQMLDQRFYLAFAVPDTKVKGCLRSVTLGTKEELRSMRTFLLALLRHVSNSLGASNPYELYLTYRDFPEPAAEFLLDTDNAPLPSMSYAKYLPDEVQQFADSRHLAEVYFEREDRDMAGKAYNRWRMENNLDPLDHLTVQTQLTQWVTSLQRRKTLALFAPPTGKRKSPPPSGVLAEDQEDEVQVLTAAQAAASKDNKDDDGTKQSPSIKRETPDKMEKIADDHTAQVPDAQNSPTNSLQVIESPQQQKDDTTSTSIVKMETPSPLAAVKAVVAAAATDPPPVTDATETQSSKKRKRPDQKQPSIPDVALRLVVPRICAAYAAHTDMALEDILLLNDDDDSTALVESIRSWQEQLLSPGGEDETTKGETSAWIQEDVRLWRAQVQCLQQQKEQQSPPSTPLSMVLRKKEHTALIRHLKERHDCRTCEALMTLAATGSDAGVESQYANSVKEAKRSVWQFQTAVALARKGMSSTSSS